jgi:RecA/RadA recombinase
VQVVQVVQRKALVELMQVTVNLLLFQVVELQHALQLVAAVVVMVELQALLVDQVVAAVMEERVDLQPRVKETPEVQAYPTAQVTG